MKKKSKNNYKLWAFIYFLLLVILYIAIYVVPKVSNIFVRTYTAEYGTLEITVDSRYLAVRTEKLYTADGEGSVSRVASEGSLLRAHSRILNLGGAGYYNKTRGVVSYFYDGLEESYTPENMASLKSTVLDTKYEEEEDGEKKGVVKECVKKNAKVGDPLFKIVDNKEWYMLCWLPKAGVEGIEPGNRLTVELSDKTRIKMTVSGVESQGIEYQVILACDRYYEKFDRIRVGDFKIIKTEKSGIILESESITTENGQPGVYIINKLGNKKFVPVKILLEMKDKTVVANGSFFDEDGKEVTTLTNYATILRSNKKGSE